MSNRPGAQLLIEIKPDPSPFRLVSVPLPGFPAPTKLKEPVISTVCITLPLTSSFKLPLLASENAFAT